MALALEVLRLASSKTENKFNSKSIYGLNSIYYILIKR